MPKRLTIDKDGVDVPVEWSVDKELPFDLLAEYEAKFTNAFKRDWKQGGITVVQQKRTLNKNKWNKMVWDPNTEQYYPKGYQI